MASQSSLIASSSSSPRTWRYNVFVSFHGPDVRKSFLSHLRRQFKENGITMFYDEEIERGQIITPELIQAIRGSRISILILSKKYASSSWCLDELLEILECKKAIGQIVMTIFYGVDPSDVRKQTGEFGIAFNETCDGKTEEERKRWSQALNDAANIAGEDFKNWDDEANMIEKIARDISDKLNATPSKDFDDMVGLTAHLRKMKSLLDLDYDGVKMVAITGPAGIGKTTIAKALHSMLSSKFQLTCFVDNLRENYHSGFDEHGLKLRLHEQFLSKILNQNGMRIFHLGAIKERLCDMKVLIILDDVNNLKQLEALANEPNLFGPGSRIVVTTENEELLQQHGIDYTYCVDFPSSEEALEILCINAFRQSYPRNGFKELSERVTELCGNLPLGLSVVGSLLRGKEEDEWEDVVKRLETILERDIEDVLRVGYDSLDENEQTLFLHIAVFFNHEYSDLVKSMFANGNLDVNRGLKILVNRSLINICCFSGTIVMHKLLQQMARQTIRKQEPWKRQILIDAHEICDVLENETEPRPVSGISFDISGINEVIVRERAFKRMYNLQFLRVYKSRYDGNDRMNIPEGMEFPRRLRLLDWEAYPSKCLPPTFHTEYLVELNMIGSQLEYLWQGTKPLTNLKKLYFPWSYHLKELPDLSNATNLEELDLSHCESLVELPSSFSRLQKLKCLWMDNCINLVLPDHLKLASLKYVSKHGCSRLRSFLFISTTSETLTIVGEWNPLPVSNITKSEDLMGLTHLHQSVTHLDLRYSDIERIPDCIKDLHQLVILSLNGCRKLTSLPELPVSLKSLKAGDCESLETVFCPLNLSPGATLDFTNCFRLGQQARREIIQHSLSYEWAILPGRKVPAKFDHRTKGNSLTIISPDGNNTLSALSRLKLCVVVSPNHEISKYSRYSEYLMWRCLGKGDVDLVVDEVCLGNVSKYQSEHLVIFHPCLPFVDSSEVSRETVFEFSSKSHQVDVIECGAKVFIDEMFEDSDSLIYGSDVLEPSEVARYEEILPGERHTGWWSWPFPC